MSSFDVTSILSHLEACAGKISTTLTNVVERKVFSQFRNFYGESFALAFLSMRNELNESVRDELLSLYERKDFDHSEFHWEFNNYAFSHFELLTESSYTKWRAPLRFKNTPCTNWTALRANVKTRLSTEDETEAREELIDLIEKRQLSNGLIQDDPGVKSFQYHCFSTVMLGELYLQTKDPRFYSLWKDAAEFIIPMILPNGDGNYIGRGQLQSFGYAALVYLLAQYGVWEKSVTSLVLLDDVLSLISKSFVRYDDRDTLSGLDFLPLTLNGREGVPPTLHSMNDDAYLGWYPYNNYFDYFPFTGFFIQKTICLLRESRDLLFPLGDRLREIPAYDDEHFLVYKAEKYWAIISRPDGYWSNDLLFPLIYDMEEARCITPLCGGEQFQESLYHLNDLPSPHWKSRTFRWRSRSYLYRNWLFLFSIWGISLYRYRFEQNSIEISEYILSLFPFKGTIAIDENWGRNKDQFFCGKWRLISSSPLSFLRTVFSASGASKLYQACRYNRYRFWREE